MRAMRSTACLRRAPVAAGTTPEWEVHAAYYGCTFDIGNSTDKYNYTLPVQFAATPHLQGSPLAVRCLGSPAARALPPARGYSHAPPRPCIAAHGQGI
eukprot:scaffold93819_cov22-Tisochrysis_lutea.AAC.2